LGLGNLREYSKGIENRNYLLLEFVSSRMDLISAIFKSVFYTLKFVRFCLSKKYKFKYLYSCVLLTELGSWQLFFSSLLKENLDKKFSNIETINIWYENKPQDNTIIKWANENLVQSRAFFGFPLNILNTGYIPGRNNTGAQFPSFLIYTDRVSYSIVLKEIPSKVSKIRLEFNKRYEVSFDELDDCYFKTERIVAALSIHEYENTCLINSLTKIESIKEIFVLPHPMINLNSIIKKLNKKSQKKIKELFSKEHISRKDIIIAPVSTSVISSAFFSGIKVIGFLAKKVQYNTTINCINNHLHNLEFMPFSNEENLRFVIKKSDDTECADLKTRKSLYEEIFVP